MLEKMNGPIAACIASVAVILRLLMLANHRVNRARAAVRSAFDFGLGYDDPSISLAVILQVVVIYLVVFSVSWLVLTFVSWLVLTLIAARKST